MKLRVDEAQSTGRSGLGQGAVGSSVIPRSLRSFEAFTRRAPLGSRCTLEPARSRDSSVSYRDRTRERLLGDERDSCGWRVMRQCEDANFEREDGSRGSASEIWDTASSMRNERCLQADSVSCMEPSQRCLKLCFSVTLAIIGVCSVLLLSLREWACLFGGLDCVFREALSQALASMDYGERVWLDHVVTYRDNTAVYVDIPETFSSRLNADLAPVMAMHASSLWDDAKTPLLVCKDPEVLMVSFSVQKSSRLPATVSFDECEAACPQNHTIRDIRDLRVGMPFRSSRKRVYAQVAEERQAPSDTTGYPRKYQSWGRVRGRLIVDLSDTGKIALQRYCGESENDVDVELLDHMDARLVTVYELKRLYNLWKFGTLQRPADEFAESLFRAVIRPLDYGDVASLPALLQDLHRRLSPPNG